MLLTKVLLTLLLSSGIAAAPTSIFDIQPLNTRQAKPAKPPPCVRMDPAPDANTTKKRFDAFAQAFIYKKNITEAFKYIAQDYIVRFPPSPPPDLSKDKIRAADTPQKRTTTPAAQNGFDSAWNILSPIWGSQNITPLRTTFNTTSNQGWLNYRTGSFGEVVDRYRWEKGCIVEHWDQGEKYPTV